jgi:hypothetical protein
VENGLFSKPAGFGFRTVFCLGSMSETTSFGTFGAAGASSGAPLAFSAAGAGLE